MNNIKERIHSKIRKGKKIRKSDLLKIESIRKNPISNILLNMYYEEILDFNKLIEDIYEFVLGNNYERKLKFLFKIYDLNYDNKITKDEVFTIICMMCDKNLERSKIQDVVDMLFVNRECIDFNDFRNIIESYNFNLKKYFNCR